MGTLSGNSKPGDAPASLPTSLPTSLPATLGRYVIQAEIGRGMMGAVYRAMDPALGRVVALKVVRLVFPLPEDQHRLMEQRFLREARLAAALSHPNIVVVHDVGWDPTTRAPYMALEYLEGRTLAEIVARGEAMDWREALRLTARLADALHHAHANGVIHRDIKPSNIVVLASGQPKVLDFGIAKASAAELTATGECWGSPCYMSPEQATGAVLDGRSDLFSLGTVLYQLLTGRRAFEGDSVSQIICRVMQQDPTLPCRLNAALPGAVDVVVTRALAKDPATRYRTGQDFAEDLNDVLGERTLRERPGLKALPTAERPSPSTPVPTRPGPTPPIPGFGLAAGISLVAALMSASPAPLPAARAFAPPAIPAALPLSAPVPLELVPPATMAASAAGSRSLVARPRATAAPLAVPPPPVVVVEAAAPAPSPEPARLAIAIQHGIKQGRLRIWIDDTLVMDRELLGNERKKLLFFKRSRGSLAEVVDVAPGERLVRFEVEVPGDRATRSGRLRSVFKSSETRILEVKIGSRVALDWRS